MMPYAGVRLVNKFQTKTAIIAQRTATASPGILRVVAVSCKVPVFSKIPIVPPTKAPTIPNKIVPRIPPLDDRGR